MKEILVAGLKALGLDADCAAPLCRFGELLLAKNQVMNLTAITEPRQVATLHFLDSLALGSYADFKGKTLVDVGTGAGFPGLPLKIAHPTLEVTLLDSLNKRVAFLQEVSADLSLTGVSCVHARAEDFATDHRECFDYATSRAVASLPLLCELCLPLVKLGGRFLAMKSVDSEEELASATSAISTLGGKLAAVEDYTVPGTAVRHRLVMIEKVAPTPVKYPRSFAKIKKDPL